MKNTNNLGERKVIQVEQRFSDFTHGMKKYSPAFEFWIKTIKSRDRLSRGKYFKGRKGCWHRRFLFDTLPPERLFDFKIK
ncbi:hypothetical protein [Xenorhabdus bovienii]|uniref:hypothetical protein n=1 Tax=Xenorhabdus bovienii TaxID=40576 RepID=UPI0023B28FD8|nr:hypothetical protein [Xenorhabdus bovienii]MDE9544166.1 hypothetical protein [Xenorhabdus bovienii]